MNTIIHGLEDGSGVVILPRETLDSLSLQVGDELQIIETDDGIILRPVPCDDVERKYVLLAMSWPSMSPRCESWLCK
ncbi:AbrB/MazE/SpoVT family DNA-binding domain-containing protein [Mesorhizobium sp. M0478]|uniref:AbrB/MazE/SpoVT family DNA-binding domain-containing protein n=1 Tax=Mesorhizobium sp. M0478 TaxID=2956947 RepID=UPI00333AB5D7